MALTVGWSILPRAGNPGLLLKAVVLVLLEFLQKPLTISPWDVKPNWSAASLAFYRF